MRLDLVLEATITEVGILTALQTLAHNMSAAKASSAMRSS